MKSLYTKKANKTHLCDRKTLDAYFSSRSKQGMGREERGERNEPDLYFKYVSISMLLSVGI